MTTWLTREEAAEHLKISVRQLNRLGLPRSNELGNPRYSKEMLDERVARGIWEPPKRKGGPRPPHPKFVRPKGDHLTQLKTELRSRRARSR